MADCSSCQGLWNNVLRAPLAEFAPQETFVICMATTLSSILFQYWHGIAIASSMFSRHYGISTFSHVAASFLSNVRRGALIHTKSAHAVWSNFRRLCLVIVALGQSQFFKPCVSSLGSLRETFQNKIDQIDVASPHSQDGDLMAIGRFQDIEQPEQPGIPSLYCNLLDAWMFEVLNCVRGLSDEDRRHIRGLKRSREGPR